MHAVLSDVHLLRVGAMYVSSVVRLLYIHAPEHCVGVSVCHHQHIDSILRSVNVLLRTRNALYKTSRGHKRWQCSNARNCDTHDALYCSISEPYCQHSVRVPLPIEMNISCIKLFVDLNHGICLWHVYISRVICGT